jgi:hypothetical protein
MMRAVARQAAIPMKRMEPIEAIEGKDPITPREPNPIIVVRAESSTPFPV